MATYRLSEIDVFATTALSGNPLAVVHGADDLSDDQLAAFARWTNFSETTFLLTPRDPSADYRVRIFTTTTELPFAGHPTLGSAHAWLAAGGTPKGEDVVQECELGLIRIRRDGDRLAFQAPALVRSGPLEDATLTQAVTALGLSDDQVVRSSWVDNGPPWVGLQLDSVESLRAVVPDYSAMGSLMLGILAPRDVAGTEVEVRAFDAGFGEDPVTGSLNAAFASWLIPAGVLPPTYTARQGRALQRDGEVAIASVDDGTIWVGGACTTVIDGTLTLP